MKIYLIVGKNIDLSSYLFEDNSLKVGIDKGAFLALKAGIKLDYAVGDFDSCSILEKEDIAKNVSNIVSLNPVKDDTDTKHAYEMFKNMEGASFIILGGIQGKRIEHFYANIELAMKDERISLLDDNSLIFKAAESFVINKNEYKYFSFFPIGDKALLSLKGFKYEISNQSIEKGQGLTISNELKDNKGYIEIISGELLCIFSKDDKAI